MCTRPHTHACRLSRARGCRRGSSLPFGYGVQACPLSSLRHFSKMAGALTLMISAAETRPAKASLYPFFQKVFTTLIVPDSVLLSWSALRRLAILTLLLVLSLETCLVITIKIKISNIELTSRCKGTTIYPHMKDN